MNNGSNPIELLVKCVALLFREHEMSQITGQDEGSSELVRKVLETIKLPEATITVSSDRDELIGMKSTAIYLAEVSHKDAIDKTEIIQRVRLNCSTDTRAFEAFDALIGIELTEGQLKKQIISLRRSLNEYMKELEAFKIIKTAFTDTHYRREAIPSMRKYIAELTSKLEPYQIDGGDGKDPALVEELSLLDTESVARVFEDMQSIESSTGILKTGWQDLNTMLQGGFRPGEEWVMPALPHNYKTGGSLSFFRQIASYNDPCMKDPTKKPLLVRFTLEDSLANNMRFLYEAIIYNRTYEMPDIRVVPVDEMVATIKNELCKRGWYVEMKRYNPSAWTYKDLQAAILKYEAEGYEVKMVMVDYLPMIPTTGCEEGPHGHALRDLYRRTRNFFSARGIVFITPHQLSTDAKQMYREGREMFVKELPGRGYYAGCKQIDQEVDGEIFMHIEKKNGRFWLTFQRGKHRGVPALHDSEKFIALPFPERGPIPDDLEGERIGRKTIGGGAIGSGDEVPVDFFGG